MKPVCTYLKRKKKKERPCLQKFCSTVQWYIYFYFLKLLWRELKFKSLYSCLFFMGKKNMKPLYNYNVLIFNVFICSDTRNQYIYMYSKSHLYM